MILGKNYFNGIENDKLYLGTNLIYSKESASSIPALLTAIQARATYSENLTCTTAILTALENIQ